MYYSTVRYECEVQKNIHADLRLLVSIIYPPGGQLKERVIEIFYSYSGTLEKIYRCFLDAGEVFVL